MKTQMTFKQKVRKSFNQAAKHYHHVAQLQQYSAKQLMQFSSFETSNNHCIVDLGSGTGFISEILNQQSLYHHIISIDIAEHMLYQNKIHGVQHLCADADYIPLKNQSIDLVISNLSLQWLPNLQTTFREIYRILKNNGLFIFSCLGEKTLYELKDAWKRVDNDRHVNDFCSEKQIIVNLKQAGFSDIRHHIENYQQNHPSIYTLMDNLKKTGAHNVNTTAPKGLLGKNKLARLEYYYEKYRDYQQLLPATFELMYFQGGKNHV